MGGIHLVSSMWANVIKKCIVFCILISCLGCTGTPEGEQKTYPAALAWDGKIYLISHRVVDKSLVRKKIGEVKRTISPMPQIEGDSNILKKGTSIYQVLDTSSSRRTIAVELNNEIVEATEHTNLTGS